MSNTFCALPFQHLCIGNEGTARPCCVTSHLVTEHGAPMSLTSSTTEEIWNSAYMRSMRRAMLRGERIAACEVCYQSEAATGHSYRTLVGSQAVAGWSARLSEISASYGPTSGFRVDRQPDFLKLEISNLCNLKCRMCFGGNSSQIERDPVHGKWSGGLDPLHAIWRGDVARIGPEPRIGVRTSGLYPHDDVDGTVRCWTDGHAIFNVPLQSGTDLKTLEIYFHSAGVRGQHFDVIVNGRPVAKGILQNAETPIAVDLSAFGDPAELTIEILSSKIVEAAGDCERGVPLNAVVLRRQVSTISNGTRPQLLSSQLAVDGPWYMDDSKIFDDVLKSVDTLQRLYITGGEPLINNRVAEVLDFLIDRGAAQRILLELSTNCTHVDAATLERLKKFDRVSLLLSLDGIGETFEYIRYPARWSVVDANVRTLIKAGFWCMALPVVQFYNVLRLTDLFRYCDELGIEVVENIMRDPARLAIQNVPPKIRKVAAEKIFHYLDVDPAAASKPSRLSLARYLDQLSTPANPELIREFMLFTNDLDATRGQSFRKTHPDLIELLAEDGFEWIDDKYYAKGKYHNVPARERAYAWI